MPQNHGPVREHQVQVAVAIDILDAQTVAALEHVSPTLYFNVPRGYAALLPRLEAYGRSLDGDVELRGLFEAERALVQP